VTAALGITPSFGHAKGDPFPKRPGRLHETGVWGLQSPLEETVDLEEHLLWLLDALEPRLDELRRLEAATACRLDFYCSYFCADASCGFDVPPSTLSRIAALGATFGVSFWASADAWGNADSE
jgi:hypothetical protein